MLASLARGVIVASTALFLLGLPAGVWFLVEDGIEPEAILIHLYAQMGWLAFIAAIVFVVPWLGDTILRRRSERERADFVELRKLFYRDDEICRETLAELRRLRKIRLHEEATVFAQPGERAAQSAVGSPVLR